jgi:UDP-N-acetylmuramate--alanine ligase
MHIYFSGIGGTATSGLALIAYQMGYKVSGSDEQSSSYIDYLRKNGVSDIHIGQSKEAISKIHEESPIDWFVYSSAVNISNPSHPELLFCKEKNIRASKRDELINEILTQKQLRLFAVAGTHGKTTTTAMTVWLFKQLDLSASYLLGAKTNFGPMSGYEPSAEYFIYECDEFDRNFLAFHPYISVISGVSWDHHEIFPSQEDYNQAFIQFLTQSNKKIAWQEDIDRLGAVADESYQVISENDPMIGEIKLAGLYNRRDAFLVAKAVHGITQEPLDKLLDLLSNFPGVSRRFEAITKNLYSDYAHTPEKINGALELAKEVTAKSSQYIVIVYEPLTNRRMHYTKDLHKNLFNGIDALYWVPSFLAREDSSQKVLTPGELIEGLSPDTQKIAKPMVLDNNLKIAIDNHLKNGDLVLCLSGGGTGSLDDWLRKEFK